MVVIGSTLRVVDGHLPVLLNWLAPESKKEAFTEGPAKDTVAPNDLY